MRQAPVVATRRAVAERRDSGGNPLPGIPDGPRGPYLLYLMSVPEEEEDLSEQGQRLLDEGWEDIEAGRLMDSDEAKRELGL